MKLLFDQNISFRVLKKIADLFPEANQVRILGLENSTDAEILQYAKANDYTIVTFDTDFYDLSLIKGTPPKIVWLRLGNISTSDLAVILRDNQELIIEFIQNSDHLNIACLEIDV